MNVLSQTQRNAAEGHGGQPAGGFNALVPELDVTDIHASLAFWCGLLGFDIAYDRPAARFAYLQREGAQIMLCQINDGWTTGPLERPFGRGINFQISASDLVPILRALENAQWPLFREAQDAWYRMGGQQETGSREFLVQDPDGYLLRFSQHIGGRNVTA